MKFIYNTYTGVEMKKIDMHCHILPGIDDGSANPKETLAMLRMALNQDFVGMIVTPHG